MHNTENTEESDGSDSIEKECYTIGSVGKLDKSAIEVSVKINFRSITMQLDTGAAFKVYLPEVFLRLTPETV